MMRKFLLVLAALAACASFQAVAAPLAHAGCVAQAGGTGYIYDTNRWPPHYDTAAAIACTSNNGTSYQMRVYLQNYQGGVWDTFLGPDVYNYSNGGNPMPTNYKNVQHQTWVCTSMPTEFSFTQVRVKVVVENNATHSISNVYGPAAPAHAYDGRPQSDCNGGAT